MKSESALRQLLEREGALCLLREPESPIVAGRKNAGKDGEASFSWRKFHSPREKSPSVWQDFAHSGTFRFEAETFSPGEPPAAISRPRSPAIADKPGWLLLCEKAENAIRREEAAKLVPARKISIPVTPAERNMIVASLGERLFYSPLKNAYRFLLKSGPSLFFGATPELLFRRAGGELLVPAIAGTRAISVEAIEPQMRAELLASEKDRHEHELVVKGIRESLARLGFQPEAPAAPGILRAPGLLHLHTPVTAADSGNVSSEALLSELHPTAAIGGFPRAAASEFLFENEPWDRGLFSAPLLFRFPGRELCLVAIRSALLTASELHFFAGAGYVRGSTPESEWQETDRKLRVMQNILFGDEHGNQ